jgi:hypothetical protein
MRQSALRSPLLRSAIAALLLAPLLASAAAIPMDVAGETDEQQVVRLTRALEADPFADNKSEVRHFLSQWTIAVPGMDVNVCKGLFDALDSDATPANGVYVLQLAFGNAAFQIEHPEQRGDQVAVQSAGLRSALALHRAIRAQKPDTAVPYLDDLQAKLDAGTFDAAAAAFIGEHCPAP